MSYKLKDLLITKVDFVDMGANQRANILITKKAQEGGENVMTPHNPVKKFLESIAKKLGLKEQEVVESITEISKGQSMTFGEAKAETDLRRISREVYDLTEALETSISSIIRDGGVANKRDMMHQSIDEFCALAKECANKWSGGNLAGISKKGQAPTGDTEDTIQKGATAQEVQPADKVELDKPNKEDNDMQINKSLLTDAEVAFLEAIEKKAGVQANEEQEEVAKAAPEVTEEKAVPETVETVEKKVEDTEDADIFKSIPAELANVIKGLESKLAQYEDKELEDVAKKYEVLGVKTEDMVPMLKSIKGNKPVYDAVLKRFDDAVAAIEQSGIFTEIGKRGKEEADGDAWKKIEKHASEIIKANPDMAYNKAIDMACQQHPDLVHEYENN